MRCALCCAGAVALGAGAASAVPIVVSVHTPANLLVGIDPVTGAIFDIGPMAGLVGGVTDIASDGHRLYVLTSEYPVRGRIYEVSPTTGQIYSGSIVTVDGQEAPNAIEAIGVDPATGNILVSLWRPGAPGAASSNNIGVLSLSGAVTGIVNYGAAADFDGLGRDPAGGLVGLNREPGVNTNELLNVSYNPPGASSIIVIPFSPEMDALDDCAVFNGEIITTDRNPKRVNRHDRTTGVVITSVPYNANYNLLGVAVVDPQTPPCAGDLDGDLDTDTTDLNILLSGFGCTVAPCAGDLDADGDTDTTDLNILLSDFGCVP